MGYMENTEAFVYLVNQLFAMSYDQHLVWSMGFQAPNVDVMDNTGKEIRLASACWHLQHNMMNLIPSLEDIALRFLLIGMKRSHLAIFQDGSP